MTDFIPNFIHHYPPHVMFFVVKNEWDKGKWWWIWGGEEEEEHWVGEEEEEEGHKEDKGSQKPNTQDTECIVLIIEVLM